MIKPLNVPLSKGERGGLLSHIPNVYWT